MANTPEGILETKKMLLVDSSVLPDTFLKVIEAKRLLQSGEETSARDACSNVGISRSAFYKYKDNVFDYTDVGERIVTLYAVLKDSAGVLSNMISLLYESGANILTVNQNIPSGGRAAVSVSFRTGKMKMSVAQLLINIKNIKGVKSIQQVAGE